MNRRSVLLLLATLIAVIGTGLVFLYVRGADDRASEQFETKKVLTVVEEITAGESFESVNSSGKLKLTALPENAIVPGALDSTESLKDLVATVPIYPGEQVIASKWGGLAVGDVLAIPKGFQAISVELSDPGRVAGFVNPGSEVAVYHQQNKEEGFEGDTRLLIERALVLGVGSTTTTTTKKITPDGQATTLEVPRTLLTLALTQEEAEKVLFVVNEEADHGNVVFGLLTDDSKTELSRGTTAENIYD
jgi:pilus assembly protein CpaB